MPGLGCRIPTTLRAYRALMPSLTRKMRRMKNSDAKRRRKVDTCPGPPTHRQSAMRARGARTVALGGATRGERGGYAVAPRQREVLLEERRRLSQNLLPVRQLEDGRRGISRGRGGHGDDGRRSASSIGWSSATVVCFLGAPADGAVRQHHRKSPVESRALVLKSVCFSVRKRGKVSIGRSVAEADSLFALRWGRVGWRMGKGGEVSSLQTRTFSILGPGSSLPILTLH